MRKRNDGWCVGARQYWKIGLIGSTKKKKKTFVVVAYSVPISHTVTVVCEHLVPFTSRNIARLQSTARLKSEHKEFMPPSLHNTLAQFHLRFFPFFQTQFSFSFLFAIHKKALCMPCNADTKKGN